MAITTSILIPSFNTRDLSVQCIRSIEKDPPSSYEIILMDNNSSDGTYDEVTRQFPHVRVMKNETNLGVGKACNRAAKEARGTFFLLLNNDAKPLPGTVDALVQWLENHPKTGIVTPQLVDANGELIQMSWGWFPILFGEILQRYLTPSALQKSKRRHRIASYLHRRTRRVPWVCCAAALIRREAFEAIGGFDEDFRLYFEDADLCFRCARQGWQMDYLAEVKAIHHLSQATRSTFNQFSLIYLQSHIAFYRKHAPFWGLWILKAYLFLKWLKLTGERADRSRFLQVVLEKQTISLPRGAESPC